nr:hypothetical protein [Enterovibrio nigricans]
MKRTLLATLMLATGASAPAMSAHHECDGDLFTMNAGRGDVGVLVDVDEGSARAGGDYFTTAPLRATLNSRALFSASAMAYDSTTDRIYYASTPTPQSYHIAETNNGDFTDEEFQALVYMPMHSSLSVWHTTTCKQAHIMTLVPRVLK